MGTHQTHSPFTVRGSTRGHRRYRRRSSGSLPLYPSLDLRFSLLLCREFPLFDNNLPHSASHLCIFPVVPLDLLIQLPFRHDHLVFPARFGAPCFLPPIRIKRWSNIALSPSLLLCLLPRHNLI